jgi:hypothetical protein
MSCKILSEILNFRNNKNAFSLEEREKLLQKFKEDLMESSNKSPGHEEDPVRIKI